MNVISVQNAIIRLIKAYTGRPIIQADQSGELPEGPHAIFKFIVPYSKGVGRPEVSSKVDEHGLTRIQTETFNMTVSFTAISDVEDPDASIELAQSIHDWFDFVGYDDMSAAGIVVSSLGDIGNRDSVNDDESRQGFDVILRTRREISKASGWIESVEVSQIKGG